MATMTRQQVSATILGCMTVHCDVVEVQSCGLEALARIAKFKPTPGKKVSTAQGFFFVFSGAEIWPHSPIEFR